MLLFCGNKILRSSDCINAIQISIGEQLQHPCFHVIFNDNTSVVVPKGTKIHLDDQILEINKSDIQCFYGTKSRFKIKFFEPEFSFSNLDPYLIGLAICTPLRNKSLQTKKKILIESNQIPKEYYSFEFKKMSNDFYQLAPEKGYPNLLRLEIKKQGNLKSISERQIPDSYLFSQKEERINLLRGCMDVFGHSVRGETTFETASPQLARDVCFLVRSLNGFAKIREKKSKSIYYIISISFKDDFNPFLIKKDLFRQSLKPRIKSISSIKDIGMQPCVNIPLEFAILENFIKVN